LVYSWKRKRIIGICIVETGVVDAHLKLPVGLGDDNRIGQPQRVVGLLDKASVEQLFDLFMDEVLPLNGLLQGFCWTGLASGWIFRWCSITSLGIPGICDGHQANTSTLA
jgi:hypothetical protein